MQRRIKEKQGPYHTRERGQYVAASRGICKSYNLPRHEAAIPGDPVSRAHAPALRANALSQAADRSCR